MHIAVDHDHKGAILPCFRNERMTKLVTSPDRIHVTGSLPCSVAIDALRPLDWLCCVLIWEAYVNTLISDLRSGTPLQASWLSSFTFKGAPLKVRRYLFRAPSTSVEASGHAR